MEDRSQEDAMHLRGELDRLAAERDQRVTDIKALLASEGIHDYEPLRPDRRQRLDELQTGDGRPLSLPFKAEIGRELTRLEMLLNHIEECGRDLTSEADRRE
jgi:transposase